MRCTLCGAENPPSATNCHVCNFKLRTEALKAKEDFRRKSEFYPSGQTSIPRFRSKTPTYAGGLLLLVALSDFLGMLVSSVYVSYLHPELEEVLLASSLFVGFFATLTTIGGFLSVFRRYRRLCIALALVTVIIHLLYGALIRMMLGACAMIFIYLAKEEFE